ncbi:hypothetical protein JAAARDRAFT_147686 [Jaapia argillacea MUCL 33604]|uniref:DUF1740-domain-containing protein n=1 Tax=Jaapia argillacea MUCL 33604 TaxID=933084 RepID=A0A067QB84_9AGAM|nr:hypothetical protein JAAARDRAFT_147686 [Jaapia argillacea MUCL 33604]
MSAPSFSSFPPSFGSFPDLGAAAGPSQQHDSRSDRDDKKKRDKTTRKGRKDGEDRGKERKGRDRNKGGEEDKRRYQERNRDDERAKEGQDRKYRGDEDVIDNTGTSKPLFYSDRKGDPLNVRYGGLHAGDIPKYHPVARGRKILGLDAAWTVVHRSAKGVEIVVWGGGRKLPQLTDSKSRTLLHSAPTRRLIASNTDKYKYDEVGGFLRISSQSQRKPDQDYRSITNTDVPPDSDYSGSSDSEVEQERSSDDESDTSPLTSLQVKLKDLEHQISEDPTAIPSWLSLLAHTLSTVPVTSKNASKARSEITLSILSRALSAHSSNRTSTRLRIKYLQAGEDIWHESKLKAEWEDAIKVGNVEIWMEWLDWRIKKAGKGLDGLVGDAERILRALQGDEMGQLRVMWRVAVAFWHAGYMERAMALFQAQAELTFEIPQSLYGLPLETQLEALEEFWDVEAFRVGESGSKGWAAWVADGSPEYRPPPRPPANENARKIDLPDIYAKWSAEEIRDDRLCVMSAGSDEQLDDPYTTILFEDIRPLLISLQSPDAKHAFRLVWLSLLGLHVPGFYAHLSPSPSEDMDDRWSSTHLASSSCLRRIFPPELANTKLITADSLAGTLVGREREYTSAFGPVKDWSYGVVDPLDGGLCGGDGKGRAMLWDKEDLEGVVDKDLVRRIFAGCRLGGIDGDDAEWDVFALAFEAAINLKGALKLSRSFLSTARESLSHWGAHARLERLRNRPDDARKVYQTVLLASATSSSRPGASLLWWDWAEMEWLIGKTEAAISVVLKSVEVEGMSGVMILRGKRALEEKMREGGGEGEEKERGAWVKLRALLDLTTSSPSAALSIFDSFSSGPAAPAAGTALHEMLTVASLTMLYHHIYTLRNPSPPGLLRHRVHESIELYPNNTIILGMFLEAEKGQGVWGRVRALMGEDVVEEEKQVKSVGRRVADAWVGSGWEKGRWKEDLERTRTGLSIAVENGRTKGSPTLWRVYLEFEIRAGELHQAKNLLFRAIGECPMEKELYLLGFGPLRSVFKSTELDHLAESMAERGIRMRRDLGEMLEEAARGDREEDSEISDDNSEYGEAEIEHRAEELRRLMPYH